MFVKVAGGEYSRRAVVGDLLRIHSRAVGLKDRQGEIVEVRGLDGGPSYPVRFGDGHESLVHPGPDCILESRALEET
ncbi:DUF1918 domain-containing protein [Streptomyces sp. NPDC059456]|uniref:DUF1918 domain-containing protein n=1 Tax=Streptomyces sp. NPDC059456 TaxID=3346838 RepID=UPI0036935608